MYGYSLNEENDNIRKRKTDYVRKGRDRNFSKKELEMHKLNNEGKQTKENDDFGNCPHQIKRKLLNRESNGNIHVGKHLGKKSFHFSECSYESNHKSDLKVHVLNNSETKLFACSECSYRTNFKRNLKRHVLTHSDTKLFSCSECFFQTNHKKDLKVHVLSIQRQNYLTVQNAHIKLIIEML